MFFTADTLHPLRQVLAKLSILSLELHELGREVGNLPGGGKDRLQKQSNEEQMKIIIRLSQHLTARRQALARGLLGRRIALEVNRRRNKSKF